jgi:Glyoxalase superfamily protein
VSRGAAVLHLTEHYGDCSPGAKVFITTDDVEALHRELAARPNSNMRPGVEVAPWKAEVMEVIDPFGNRLCFNQPL